MEKLGVGREAEVYAVSDTECIKLYYPGYTRERALREAGHMQTARAGGASVPDCYGVVELEGRVGLRMERLSGRSMLYEALAHPEQCAAYGELLGKELRKIHAIPGKGCDDLTDGMRWGIRHTELLTDAEKDALCARLARMERGDRLLHLDCHMDNVVMTPAGPCVIDWAGAACGHPLADAARTLLACELRIYPMDADEALKEMLDSWRGIAAEGFLRGYGVDREQLEPWMPLTAASRLSFGPPEEREQDLRIVRAGL